jgi:hypothetical protein
MTECPANYIVDVCYDDCSITNDIKTEVEECVVACTTEYPFLDDKICRKECPGSKKYVLATNVCVDKCTDAKAANNNLLLDLYKCVPSCVGKFFTDTIGEKNCMPPGPNCQEPYEVSIQGTNECLASCQGTGKYQNMKLNICEDCRIDMFKVEGLALCVENCDHPGVLDYKFYDG